LIDQSGTYLCNPASGCKKIALKMSQGLNKVDGISFNQERNKRIILTSRLALTSDFKLIVEIGKFVENVEL